LAVPYQEAAMERMQKESVVLYVNDTTSLDYTKKPSIRHYKQITARDTNTSLDPVFAGGFIFSHSFRCCNNRSHGRRGSGCHL
jgi:hypothetical protein